ncbi:hypothetical protein J2S19_003586 [Metabacillus malikii]|uniref:Uncharacterized protein n=1 Tax=Metabacillus malikii TaxID=1504265 RepID=A0ABT9ZJ47_9BACI|nr:hypothetical protein [Metabacillus malikii]
MLKRKEMFFMAGMKTKNNVEEERNVLHGRYEDQK